MMRFVRFAFLAVILAVAALHTDGAFAQKNLEELQKDMNTATGKVDGATKEAHDALPAKTAKDTEDTLDAAIRKNADTPASNKAEKAKTDKAETEAQKAADATAKNDANAQTYRAALKKRRDARNELKAVCAQLANLVQRRRRQAGAEAVKEAEDVYKKCLDALRGSEAIVTAALFDNGPSPGLQQGQEYVSRPAKNDDVSAPICYSWDCSSELTKPRPNDNLPRPCYSWDCSFDPLANPKQDPKGSDDQGGTNKIIPFVPITPVQPQTGPNNRF